VSKSLKTIIFGVIFTIGGILLSGSLMIALFKATDSLNWPAHRGNIVKSEVCFDEQARNQYFPCVSYEFELDGKQYRSNNIWLYPWREDKEFAAITIASYPVGAEVTVFLNPSNPHEAILVKSSQHYLFLFFILSLMLVIVGVWLIFYSINNQPSAISA
jgi:hypothetical protein